MGSEAAVMVPVSEYRRLWTLARLAGPEDLEAAAASPLQPSRPHAHQGLCECMFQPNALHSWVAHVF